MTERDRLRDEVAVASALTLGALADEPGADSVSALAGASHLAAAAEQSLHLIVLDAREAGVTWAAIGEALGITRQAAYKRFGGQVPQKVTREPSDPPRELVGLAVDLLDDAAAGRFDRIEALASPHLRRIAGSGGIRRAFSAVDTIFGDLVSREAIHARLIGRVVHVHAIEQRTLASARAEVTLGPDSTLLGLNYLAPDAT